VGQDGRTQQSKQEAHTSQGAGIHDLIIAVLE
jgi:hypothetical protein